jgi:hypothetical protein
MKWGYELRCGSRVFYVTEAQLKELRRRVDLVFATARVLPEPPTLEAARAERARENADLFAGEEHTHDVDKHH